MNKTVQISNKKFSFTFRNKLIDARVLFAFIVCAILIIIGIVRVLSYSRNGLISHILEDSILHHFAYRPESYLNVSYFKLFATPSIIALIYFIFRGLNDNKNKVTKHKINNDWTQVNFKSFLFRFILTVIITICWIPLEVMKFSLGKSYYPYSELEDPLTNIFVLIAGGILCLFLMKYLPFGPLIISKK